MTTEERTELYPGRHLSTEDIFRAIEALGPRITEAVPAIRAAGRLPADLMEDLRATGIFRAAFPAAWGGPEMGFTDQVTLIERMARVDASTAWTTMILFDSGFFAGNFDPSVVREVYPSMDMATAVSQHPPGRAVEVDGGYRVTGRYRFGSGSFNADVFACPSRMYRGDDLQQRPDGEPLEGLFFVPADEVTVHDTWHVIGLQGTGSTDYEVEDHFVPARKMFVYDQYEIGEQRPPLSRYNQYLALSQFGVILGITRHLLDELRATIENRIGTASRQAIKLDPLVQTGVPEAEALYGAARAYLHEYTRETDDIVFNGRPLTKEHVAKFPLVSVTLARLCRKAADRALELVGTDAVFVTRPWDQLYADLRVASSHVLNKRSYYAEYFKRLEA